MTSPAINPNEPISLKTQSGLGVSNDSPFVSKGSEGSASDPGSVGSAKNSALEKQKEMAGVPIVLPMPMQNLPDLELALNFDNLLTLGSTGSKNTTPKEAQQAVNLMVMKATTNILTAWINNLREVQEYKDAATAVEKEQDKMTKVLKKQLEISEENGQENRENSDKFTSTGLLMCAGMMALGLGQTTVNPGSLAAASIQEMGAIVHSVQPSMFDGAVGSLVSLFSAGLVTQATVMSLKSGGKAKQAYNYDYAKNYAERTLQVVSSHKIDEAVQSIGGSQDESTLTTKATLAKVALLSQTLAFSYRLETGSLTGQEILQGTLDKSDFRYPLIQALHAQINQIPPQQKVAVLEKVMAYLDSKPNLDALAEPAEAIRGMFGKITVPIQDT